jgi:hypothetical protein
LFHSSFDLAFSEIACGFDTSSGNSFAPVKRGDMPLKKQVSLAEMKVGIFATIALLLLAGLILQQSWDAGLKISQGRSLA